MTIKVLVADDQELVRAGFVMVVNHQTDLEVVGEAADGAQAVELAGTLAPDVVLMDLRMPRMDGIEATHLITTSASDRVIRVLILTTFDDDESVYAALQAGASGFLLKEVATHELGEAIRIVAAGDSLLAPSITRRIIERVVADRPVDSERKRRIELLTHREVEVLRYVAKGMTNSEIASVLFVAEATVKSHVSHILTKLGARDRAQAVAFAYEGGLVASGS